MRWLSAGIVVAAVLSAAGCGGGDDTASQAAPGGGTDARRASFAECLRKNGVTLPSGFARPSGAPTGRPSGRPSRGPGFDGFRSMSPEMQKAFEACRSLLPAGGGGFNRNPANSAALQAFRTCMKDNGARIPDGTSFRDLDENDPKIAKALEKCRPLLPSPAAPSPEPTG